MVLAQLFYSHVSTPRPVSWYLFSDGLLSCFDPVLDSHIFCERHMNLILSTVLHPVLSDLNLVYRCVREHFCIALT